MHHSPGNHADHAHVLPFPDFELPILAHDAAEAFVLPAVARKRDHFHREAWKPPVGSGQSGSAIRSSTHL